MAGNNILVLSGPRANVNKYVYYAFVCAYILFLLYVSNIVWNEIDSELASVQFKQFEWGAFRSKYPTLAVFGICLLFAKYIENPIRRIGILFFLLFVLAILSIAWSINQTTTLFFIIQLAFCSGFSLCAVRILGFNETVRLIWLFSAVVILASIVLAALNNPHAVMGGIHAGAWRGIFGHKNSFAPFLVTHIVLSVVGRRVVGLPSFVAFGFAALDVFALIMSRGSTGIVACVGALAVSVLFLPVADRALRKTWRAVATIVVITASFLVFQNSGAVLAMMDRDPTLTNRTLMWEQVIDQTFKRKLGTGYGTGGGSEASLAIQKAVGRQDAQSVQSGYLNMALEFGWGGVVLFAVFVLVTLVRCCLDFAESPAQALLAAVFTQHAAYSYTEVAGAIYPSWSMMIVLTALIGYRAQFEVQRPRLMRPQQTGPIFPENLAES